MKAIKFGDEVYGPYFSAERTDSGWQCDATFYPDVVVGSAEIVEWVPPQPVKSADILQKEIVSATQQRLDKFARTRNYDGILSACTYVTSTNAKFNAEGQYCVEARDATWAKLYAILAEVEAGTRPMPTGYADIEPELPVLTWPN